MWYNFTPIVGLKTKENSMKFQFKAVRKWLESSKPKAFTKEEIRELNKLIGKRQAD